MLDKDEIYELLKDDPFITILHQKVSVVNKKKDLKLNLPRIFLTSNIILPNRKYTIVLIQERSEE